jgi:hypothetical protein
MNVIHGTWKNGQIQLDEPADWPEGCRVVIEPAARESSVGIPEEDWPETPEEIAEWLKWYDAIEPLEMTPEEEAEWAAARQAQKDYEKRIFNEHADELGKIFE